MAKVTVQAKWFGIERKQGAVWMRCRLDAIDPPDDQWFDAREDPKALAQTWGPGTYRIVWCDKDRRRKSSWRFSEEFEVPGAGAGATRSQAEASSGAGGSQAEASSGAGGRSSGAPIVDAGLARMAAPKDPAAMPDPHHPISLFHMLHQVYRDDRQAERERELHMWTMMLETQRASSQLSLAQMAQFNELMMRTSNGLNVERAELDRQHADARQRPLLDQIEQTNRRLSELAMQLVQQGEEDDDEEDPEAQAEAALAKMGEEPSDGQRIIAGIASIMQTVATFAQTPMGEAIARRILQVDPSVMQRRPEPEAAE